MCNVLPPLKKKKENSSKSTSSPESSSPASADEDDILSHMIHAKKQRAKVYSGNNAACYMTIPNLYEMCIRVLIEKIDGKKCRYNNKEKCTHIALDFPGRVPYCRIKPALERATVEQLFSLEYHNRYLVKESDLIWKFHCNKEFRTKQREESETWRDMYKRCLSECNLRLKNITDKVKQSMDNSARARSKKLLYIHDAVKPPCNVLRKQAKKSDLKKRLITSSADNRSTHSETEIISVPPQPTVQRRTAVFKPKGPLMAKTLWAIRDRYRR